MAGYYFFIRFYDFDVVEGHSLGFLGSLGLDVYISGSVINILGAFFTEPSRSSLYRTIYVVLVFPMAIFVAFIASFLHFGIGFSSLIDIAVILVVSADCILVISS